MVTNKLRFAPLVRVSGEEQERTGESLRTQRRQIEQAVETMDGTIPKRVERRYSGQEHATPRYERERLAALLEDAGKGLFDAVIVADVSRWSRSNEKSEQGLKVLRQNGIRFFVCSVEHDLHAPEAMMFLSMSSVINQYLAQTQAKKSIDNRLERLRRGCPANGASPFGRKFDRETEQWSVIPEDQEFIQGLAERYIKGESITRMAKEVGKSASTVWKQIVKQAGGEFVVTFHKPAAEHPGKRIRHGGRAVEEVVRKNRRRAKRLNPRVKEIELDDRYVFIIQVPPLLDKETLQKVKEVADKRRKSKGRRKHRYLLGGHIYCGECGKTMSGQTLPTAKKRYYRHHKSKSVVPVHCEQDDMFVDADAIEEAVLLHLFGALGNVAQVKKAIKKAYPNREQQEKMFRQSDRLKEELKAVVAARERILGFISKGTVTEYQATKQLNELSEQEDIVAQEIEALDEKLKNALSPAELDRMSRKLDTAKRSRPRASVALLAAICTTSEREHFLDMTWEDGRELVDVFFSGQRIAGQKFGVFVWKDGDWEARKRKGRKWRFEIRGRLPLEVKCPTLPLSDNEKREVLMWTAQNVTRNLRAFLINIGLLRPPE